MSKQVTIPSNMNPWWCNINGVVYSYTAGSTRTVPDEVAAVIENYNNMLPKLDEPLKNKLYGTGNSGEPCLYDKGSFESNEELFYITADSVTGTYTINGVSKDDAGWNAMYTKMCASYGRACAWSDSGNTPSKKRCRFLIYEPLAYGLWVGDSNTVSFPQNAYDSVAKELTVVYMHASPLADGGYDAQIRAYVLKGTGGYSCK